MHRGAEACRETKTKGSCYKKQGTSAFCRLYSLKPLRVYKTYYWTGLVIEIEIEIENRKSKSKLLPMSESKSKSK
jgi:hypothetical protein